VSGAILWRASTGEQAAYGQHHRPWRNKAWSVAGPAGGTILTRGARLDKLIRPLSAIRQPDGNGDGARAGQRQCIVKRRTSSNTLGQRCARRLSAQPEQAGQAPTDIVARPAGRDGHQQQQARGKPPARAPAVNLAAAKRASPIHRIASAACCHPFAMVPEADNLLHHLVGNAITLTQQGPITIKSPLVVIGRPLVGPILD
jgi:hypothetical protein